MTAYQLKSQATRSRRQAAGKYAKPTPAQRSAFARYIAGGWRVLSQQECEALAGMATLASSQRQYFATLAAQAA